VAPEEMDIVVFEARLNANCFPDPRFSLIVFSLEKGSKAVGFTARDVNYVGSTGKDVQML
jgi:hypothetical protein